MLLRILFLIALWPAYVAAQTAPVPDSFIVRKLKCTNNVSARHVQGIEVSFELEYRGRVSKLQEETLIFHLGGLDNKTLVAARGPGQTYRDKNNFFYITRPLDMRSKQAVNVTQHILFIPYYVLDLQEGKHELRPYLRLKRNLGQAQDVATHFANDDGLDVQMPRSYRVQFVVSQAEVEPLTLDGKTWDKELGNKERGLPDLRWQLALESTQGVDVIYNSEEVRNTNKAAWANPCTPFWLTENDKLTLNVLDIDELDGSNRIGMKVLTLAQLQAWVNEGKPQSFDRVVALTPTKLVVE